MGQTGHNWDLDEVERELHATGWANIVGRPSKNTPRGRYLYARAALSSGKPHHMSDALQRLGECADIPSIGMKAALLAQMREAELTIQLELPKSPRTHVELDGACWFYFARSLTLSDLGQQTTALVEIGIAKAFAGIIGLSARTQLLELHVHMFENLLGQTNVAAIEKALKAPMPDARRDWATNNFVAGLMQIGEYENAYQAAVPDSHWHNLTGAILGRTKEVTGETDLFAPAQAWIDLRAGRDVELVTGLRTGIPRDYAQLAAAAYLARSASTAHHAPRVLSAEPPERADQAALWAVIMLQALSRGATIPNPLNMPVVLTNALSDLRSTFDVLNVLEAVAPEGLLIAAYGPRALNEVVHVRLSAVKKSLVRQDVESFLKGYRGEEVEPSKHANLGSVVSGIQVMVDVAMDEGRSGLLHQWNRAHAEALWDLSPKLRTALQAGDSHCTPTVPGRTVDA